MLRSIYYFLNPLQRLQVRRLFFAPLDMWEKLTGKKDPEVPPRGMIFTGGGDFIKAGKKFLGFFIKYGKLEPHHRVLDVGSGIGRMAIPLTKFLNEKGSYEGFDIIKSGIRWCRENITSRYPKFRFQMVDLQNDLYRSEGKQASDFRFPYRDQDFDFVFLTSVFTHMLPKEVENYMKEINRVLKPGGRCFATFFIFSSNDPHQGIKPVFDFSVNKNYYRLMDAKVQSANVAYSIDYVTDNLGGKNGFTTEKVVEGWWKGFGEKEDADFQDIVVFHKI
ncbi:MAG: class I SAM-dependent methyltransferase [Bacteroidota bacterium]